MKKKSQTKRIVILALLLLVIAAIWAVMANRFESFVKNEILPKLERHESWVKTDPSSIKIDKYKFSVSIGEIIIFPNSEILAIKTDQIKFSYNPFKKQITAHLTGKKLEVGQGDLGFYYENNPSDFITFNQEILLGDLNNMLIKFNSNSKTEIKDNLKNELICSLEGETDTITGKNNPVITDNYQLGFDLDGKNIQYYNSDYFKRLVFYIYGALDKKDSALFTIEDDFDSFGYTTKTIEVTGPLNIKSRYSLELKKEHFQSILLILKGEKTLPTLISEFNFFNDLYFLTIDSTVKNSSIEDKYLMSLSNDGNKISTDIKLSYNKNLNDTQKVELRPYIAAFLYKGINHKTPGSDISYPNLAIEDVDALAAKFLDFKDLNFKIKGSYDKTSKDLEQDVAVQVNNHSINIAGTGKLMDMTYDGNIKISDPDKLINSVVDFTQTAIYPIAYKMSLSNPDSKTNEHFKVFVNNLKENGFRALGAFSKENVLNSGDPLNVGIHFNLKGFEVKFNDKPFLDIMTDERVIPFLKGMPQDNYEQQNINGQQPAE